LVSNGKRAIIFGLKACRARPRSSIIRQDQRQQHLGGPRRRLVNAALVPHSYPRVIVTPITGRFVRHASPMLCCNAPSSGGAIVMPMDAYRTDCALLRRLEKNHGQYVFSASVHLSRVVFKLRVLITGQLETLVSHAAQSSPAGIGEIRPVARSRRPAFASGEISSSPRASRAGFFFFVCLR